MGFPRQEYWSGLPFPYSGNLPNPGMEPVSSALKADSLPLSHLGSPLLLFSPTLCHLMDRSTSGFPVSHYLWVCLMDLCPMMLSSHLILCHPFLLLYQSESFPVSQLLASGDQSMGASASASVLLMNIQGWFPLGFESLWFKRLSKVFSLLIQCLMNMNPFNWFSWVKFVITHPKPLLLF